MAGLHQSEVVDLVAEEANGNVLLVIVEARRWTHIREQTEQLKAKLNTYAQFALDGGLASQYPELASRTVTIRLECAASPPDAIKGIMAAAATRLQDYGIDVLIKVNPRL